MVASALASGDIDTKLSALGILAQVQEYRKTGEQQLLEALMPDNWIDQLAIAGASADWQAAIRRFVDIGAHSVILVPLPDADLDEVDRFARHLSRDRSKIGN
jgi:hypothetical protein